MLRCLHARVEQCKLWTQHDLFLSAGLPVAYENDMELAPWLYFICNTGFGHALLLDSNHARVRNSLFGEGWLDYRNAYSRVQTNIALRDRSTANPRCEVCSYRSRHEDHRLPEQLSERVSLVQVFEFRIAHPVQAM